MKNIAIGFAFLLFVVLVPGICATFPPHMSKIPVALTHALLFAIVFSVIYADYESMQVKSKNASYSTLDYTQSYPEYTGYFIPVAY